MGQEELIQEKDLIQLSETKVESEKLLVVFSKEIDQCDKDICID